MQPERRVCLRTASPADGPEIAGLFIAARQDALPYLPKLHTDDETREWMTRTILIRCEVWVATIEENIAGFLALDRDVVEHLYVRPGFRRRRIGSQLLAKAKERSSGRLRLFTFQRNCGARNFYEARGFVAVAFGDGSENEEKEPDVLYAWSERASPPAS